MSRKLIDITDEQKTILSILAAKEGKSLKIYIQELLEEHADDNSHLLKV